MCRGVCLDSCMHVCRKTQIPIIHVFPQGGPESVCLCMCLSLSPVRKEGWSVFSGQTPLAEEVLLYIGLFVAR